jgi:hypothetical protein
MVERLVRASILAAFAATAVLIGGSLDAADDPPRVAAEPPMPAGPPMRRFDPSTESALRRQLADVPTMGFTQSEALRLYNPLAPPLKPATTTAPPPAPKINPNALLLARLDVGPYRFEKMRAVVDVAEFHSLPWRVRANCKIPKARAATLNELSTEMRRALPGLAQKAPIRKGIPDISAQDLRAALKSDQWTSPEGIPALIQLLQSESVPLRTALVELLGDIQGPEASVALARRAVFDLSPDIREKAVRLLQKRPTTEYVDALAANVRYPWPPAAYHAAEAIAFLELKEASPTLSAIVREPDPRLPTMGHGTMQKTDGVVTRELVRVNHLCNCLLCHAPSKAATDPVRGRIPIPGEEPPALYYASPGGIFARADITYLRQDFSVVQTVAPDDCNQWPAEQRFDFMVRQKKLPASPTVLAALSNATAGKEPVLDKSSFDASKLPDLNFHQKAAMFALLALEKK